MDRIAEYGNPLVRTFRKKFIRKVSAGVTTVFVHAEIFDLVSAILNECQSQGVELPEQLRGWVEPTLDQTVATPANYGLEVELVEGMEYEKWGFTIGASGDTVVFDQDVSVAKDLSEFAETERLKVALGTQEPVEGRRWQKCRPGSRDLTMGDCGDDVKFLQLVMDSPEQDGVFGPGTLKWVEGTQANFRQPLTGKVTDDLWGRILPRPNQRFSLSRGDAGLAVRVLQAALVAYGWKEDLRITSRYDRDTDIAIRNLQYQHGCRVTGRSRSPEWLILTGLTMDN